MSNLPEVTATNAASRQRVALLMPKPGPWQSLARTARFYQRALQKRFELIVSSDEPTACSQGSLDAIVNFGIRGSWRPTCAIDVPRIHPLHGGLIVDLDSVKRDLRHLKSSDLLLVNCSSDLEIIAELSGAGGPRACLVPLPVDERTFCRRSVHESREMTNCQDFDHVIGFVARLLPQKNLHGFLKLLAELQAAFAPQRIGGLVIGKYWLDYPCLPYMTTQYPDYIRSQIRKLNLESNVVYYPSTLTDQELSWCYNSMTALLHPTMSIDENFGYSPVEAMSCGVPVVGSAYGGLKDTVRDGLTGYLMPSWITEGGLRIDYKTAYDALYRLILDASLRQQVSLQAERHVQASYNEEVCSSTLVSCIQAAIRIDPSSSKTVQVKDGLSAPVAFQTNCYRTTLPETSSPPWRDYLPAVAHYVSTHVSLGFTPCYLRLAADLMRLNGNEQALDDPAWPAQYRFDENTIEFLETFQSWRKIDPMGLDAASLSRLEELLHVGVLVVSRSCVDA